MFLSAEDKNKLRDETGQIKSKRELIDEMNENGYDTDLDYSSPKEDVIDAYLEYYDEFIDDPDYLLFPNGRDIDAEDEDGIF